jgi:2-oxoglutarate ferredoxin oxidoreductase subunit beta
MSEPAVRWQDYKSHLNPIWCPGCGHFGVLNATYQALAKLQIPQHEICFISGIGCSSRIPGYTKTYGFNSIHGRALPLASGVKLANSKQTVIVATGDGDCMAIGAGHFPHTAKRNVDITVLMMDNGIYGLTKGQTSPTSPHEMKTKSAYYGNQEIPGNPLALALAYQATFVARSFSANIAHLSDIIARAIRHKGFSFVQILSPCVTYRGREQFTILRELCVPLPETHSPSDKMSAYKHAEDPEKLWIGLYYEAQTPTLEDKLNHVMELAEKAKGKFDKESLLKRFQP